MATRDTALAGVAEGPDALEEAVRPFDARIDHSRVCSGGLANIMKKRAVSAP
jgi:hypothetical protein